VDALLEATARVLKSHGVEGLTTNEIARVAGVSVGSVYQYFPDKQALVAALVERKAERDLAEIMAAVGARSGDEPRAALRRGLECLVALHHRDLALRRALLLLVARVGQYDAVRAIANRGQEALRLLLAGSVPPERLDIASFLLFHAVEHWVHMAVLERPDLLETPAFVDEIERLWARYLDAPA
jgi:AcrR family transcriptional regulator